MEVIEYHGDIVKKALKKVPMKDLLEQHRKRFVCQTSVGDIVLKKLTHCAMEEVVIKLTKDDPKYLSIAQRGRHIWQKFRDKTELTEDEAKLLEEYHVKLAPFAKHYALACIEEPEVKTLEDYDALMSSLTTEEKAQLQELLLQMINPVPKGEISPVVTVMNKDYGIPLTDDLTMENMTAEQVQALLEAKKAETQAKLQS